MRMLRENLGNLQTRDCVKVTVVVIFQAVVINVCMVIVAAVVILRAVVIQVCLVIVECAWVR